jgi:DNA polymerase-3 subunit delta
MAKNLTLENYERIVADLQRKIYKPVYLLMGTEPYFIDRIANRISQQILTEEEKAFNLLTLYGEDCTVQQVHESALRYPMMSNHQVIIVKEAQNLKGFDNLDVYAAMPQPATILVLCFKGKSVDKRKMVFKNTQKNGEVLESTPFPAYGNDLENWIIAYLKQQNRAIDSRASHILTEALGEDLTKITNELDKLQVLLPQNTLKITADEIERYVGISKDFNAFEFCSALMQKDAFKANRIINHFEKNPKEFSITATMSSVFTQFSRLFAYQMLKSRYKAKYIPEEELRNVVGIHPFIIKKEYEPAILKFNAPKTARILSQIRIFDLRSKGWHNETTAPCDLLRELTSRIIGG